MDRPAATEIFETGETDPAASAVDTGAPLRRLTAPAYADGLSAPRASEVAAIDIANAVFTQGPVDIPSEAGLSALWIFWGQFLDHDLSLTPEQEGPGAEFLKFEGPGAPFNVTRSEAHHAILEDEPREQINAITPLIDASNVYGSDPGRTLALRSFDGGRMRTSEGPDGTPLLPDERDLGVPAEAGFAAGDARVQENPGLSLVHTLWVNEHNHWADRLAGLHPDWDDERLFHGARDVVEMLIQQITYEEFLPHLIGDALAPYAGFDASVDAQISTEFATAAYRFGHTSIPENFRFLDEAGARVTGDLGLFETFETDRVLREIGAEATLRGLLETPTQALDTKVVDSLNVLLFTPDGGLTGFSLPERNILRGRDHGIDTWLEVRAALLGDVDAPALSGSTDFSVITEDAAVAAELASVYPTLGDVDLWVGGLAEDAAPGAAVGPTFQAILTEQFAASRDGDPDFYLSREIDDPAIAAEIEATRFSDVLMRSGGVAHVQREAFLASDRQGGGAGTDHLKGGAGRDLLIGFAGDDYLKGRAGGDDLFGDGGRDMLRGGEGADALTGGAGRDKLMGGGGADRIAGGPGADLLMGGAGADVFVFAAGESGIDSLMDFRPGEDRLELWGFGPAPEIEIRTSGFMAEIFVDGEGIAQIIGRGHWDLALDDMVSIA